MRDPREPSAPEAAGAETGETVEGGAAQDAREAAREALARARRAARGKGLRPGSPARAGAGVGAQRTRPGSTGTGGSAADRDPQLVGREVERLVAGRGWSNEVQVGGVVGRWSMIVGEQVAANVQVVAFEGTVLTVQARTSAWATQMRLLTATVLGRIEEGVGEGLVTEIVVKGPGSPSWRKGPLSSKGRGPRDTYG